MQVNLYINRAACVSLIIYYVLYSLALCNMCTARMVIRLKP